ncbi:hypothetical protein [Pseudomonas sp. W03]|uniref:hypothetical protein n=1 Tax=Pseudomonas sp. W03 TaxID=3090666 RepID=UPI003A4E2429
MATMYLNTDTGAPGLTLGNGASFSFNAFKLILKAVLVSGYGSKPAAGWVLVAEGTNYLVLRNGPGSGYICFTLTGTSFAVRVTMAATFDGVVSDIITGQGVKTGTAANNAVPHYLALTSLALNAQYSWAFVADARSVLMTVYCWGGNSNAQYANLTGQADQGLTLAFGEDSGGNFMALGGVNTTNFSSATNDLGSGGLTALRDPATGLLVDTGSIAPVTPLSQGQDTGQTVYPLEQVDLVRFPWMVATKAAGFIRGLARQPASVGYLNYALRSVGRGSVYTDITNANAATPFDLGPGLSVVPLKVRWTVGGLYMTLDARFW